MELTNKEKIEIVNQRIKTILFSEYNLELNIKENEIILDPDITTLDTLERQRNDLIRKRSILQKELDSLNEKKDEENGKI